MEPGANVVVFGLGGIGLNVVQGARMAGADMIIGVDLNPGREELARKFGMTHFVNPKTAPSDLVAHLVELTKGGADYSFECVGSVDLIPLVELAPVQAQFKKLEGCVRHAFTHFELEVEVYLARDVTAVAGAGVWAPMDGLDAFALPNLMRKVLRHALADGDAGPLFGSETARREAGE